MTRPGGRAWPRRLAIGVLLAAGAVALFANILAPAGYEVQFREEPGAAPSVKFPLGTDELGRDRLSRLLYGIRVSFLLAPAAASLAIGIALVLGLAAGDRSGIAARAARELTDLTASVPTLLLLFFARALVPLNVGPEASVTITFFLLGAVGWSSAVRVFAAAAARARDSEYVRQAHAAGCRPFRVNWLHISAALRPVIAAQFWILVPLFLMAEANLGMLGLGVSEPLPSLGNLLAEIQITGNVAAQPWLFAPAIVLVTVLLCLQSITTKENA